MRPNTLKTTWMNQQTNTLGRSPSNIPRTSRWKISPSPICIPFRGEAACGVSVYIAPQRKTWRTWSCAASFSRKK
jgi:hypothetical protein